MSGGAGAETIFALSSGAPPAGVSVVRVSGPEAGSVLRTLASRLPPPRRATLAALRDPATGALLDRALVLWFPGPASATGEDVAELHLHGGRAVVKAVLDRLADLPRLRSAAAGEFTRRAFDNGRIDLAEAEGLADLVAAETEAQRRNALALAGGVLSRRIEAWQEQLLSVSARIEAALDFADEDDVPAAGEGLVAEAEEIAHAIAMLLAAPSVERLRDGIRVAIAGPPNAGKSTLLNALVGREAAITSPQAGTTRDVIEAPVAFAGVPFLFSDTAGLRETGDGIEQIGVARARSTLAAADIVLWLGEPADAPIAPHVTRLHAQCDRPGRSRLPAAADLAISAVTGEGLDALVTRLLAVAGEMLPHEGEIAIGARQREALSEAVSALRLPGNGAAGDILILAEACRLARHALDRITGRAGVEDMLNALFGRFCIGK